MSFNINTLMTNPVFYGSAAHFLGGFGILMTVAYFSGAWATMLVAWLMVLVATAVKEFWYDTHYEIPVQDIKGGWRDFLSYQAGAMVAIVVWVIGMWVK